MHTTPSADRGTSAKPADWIESDLPDLTRVSLGDLLRIDDERIERATQRLIQSAKDPATVANVHDSEGPN